MLQQVREHVQGWIASVIIGLLVITFALWGIQSYLGGGAKPNDVAKVNGETITEAALNSAYNRIRQNLQAQQNTPLTLNDPAQVTLKQQALQQLISMKVLSDAATKAGYSITPMQLDSFIMQMPAFQTNGQFAPNKLQMVLNALNYSQDQFITELERSLLISQAQIGIQNSAFGLPGEAQQTLKISDQKRDISYVIIPAAKFQNSVTVSAADINNYYQQHPDQFKTPEKLSIQYIELSVDQIAKNLQVSDQELQQYYQDNIAAFTKNGKVSPLIQVKSEVEKALKQQKMQQAFSDQSQQLSDLTYTNSNSLTPAANTLNLKIQTTGYFTRTGDKTGLTANPQIITAAFNEDVVKNNNNSNPIPVKDGDVIVLRVKDYQPAAVMPLLAVKNQIEQILKAQAAQVAAQQSGEKILAELQTDNMQKISAQDHLNWQSKNNASRQSSGMTIPILQAAFSLPKPRADKPSVVGIALSNGDYALVAVNKVVDDMTPISAQQQSVMQNEIENDYAQLEYQLYVNTLIKNASIKIYPQTQQQNS